MIGDTFGQGGGDRVLGHFGPVFHIGSGYQVNRVLITTHDAGARAYIIGDNPVAALARSFALGVVNDLFRLGGKTHDQTWPAAVHLAQRRQNVGIFHQVQRRRPAASVLFHLLLGLTGDAPIGHGGGTDGDIGGQGRFTGRQHLGGGFDVPDRYAAGVGLIIGAGDQHHLGTQPGQGGGNGVALLTRGTVG